MVGNPSDSDFDDSDVSVFGEFDEFDEHEDDGTSDMEENKLFIHPEFSSTIDVGRIITIYSSQTVNEPFFLCKVHEKQISTFLMIMIIIYLQAMISWSLIILKRHLKTFNKEMFNTNRKYMYSNI